MCNKLGYCNPRHDKCLVEILLNINKEIALKTLASCCGHGIYNPTIIVLDIYTDQVFEWYSGIFIKKKVRNRYYVRDNDNYYYIPELVSPLQIRERKSNK